MKKVIALCLAVSLALGCAACLSGCGGEKTTLYVYNWVHYIAEGGAVSLGGIADVEA